MLLSDIVSTIYLTLTNYYRMDSQTKSMTYAFLYPGSTAIYFRIVRQAFQYPPAHTSQN